MFKLWKRVSLAFLAMMLAAAAVLPSFAAVKDYENSETGYSIYADDAAGLLTDEELEALTDEMAYVADYCNAVFFTTRSNDMESSTEYAEKRYKELFGEETGTAFLIDLDKNHLASVSYGEIDSFFHRAGAKRISDAGIADVSAGNYYEGAEKAFWEAYLMLTEHYDPEIYEELMKNPSPFEEEEEENQLLCYINEENQYSAIIDDRAGLMTQAERRQLEKDLQPVTEFGNAVVITVDSNPYGSTPKYAESLYHEFFDEKTSGSLLLIDMDERYIYIFSDGENYDIVSKSRAEVITDNCYNYASKKDYYTCAKTAFEQINDLLNGRKIAQPMKYFSNALLALLLALIINYKRIGKITSLTETTARTMASSVKPKFAAGPEINMVFRRTAKTKLVHGGGGGSSSGGWSSSSGGYSGSHSSSHSSSSGSRSSGGHSGGGGGHRF